ncbi:hypothetical protein ASZ90_009939 [hydrocarbon metagenome]|uniref:Uncharacterized protein n=1 Tax=hydrocarbon metagenome TaxID=938273 RepID=A0A0W8FHE5_9ZZZZ
MAGNPPATRRVSHETTRVSEGRGHTECIWKAMLLTTRFIHGIKSHKTDSLLYP